VRMRLSAILGVPASFRAELWLTMSGAAFDRPGEAAYRLLLDTYKVRQRPTMRAWALWLTVGGVGGWRQRARTNDRPPWTTLRKICTGPFPSTPPISRRCVLLYCT
jgi:hypothetical protein